MTVRRNLAGRQRNALGATALPQRESGTDMDRNAALEIGKGKSCLPISAIRSADKIEKRIVLIDRNDRAIAKRPAVGGKVPGKHPNLTDKRA